MKLLSPLSLAVCTISVAVLSPLAHGQIIDNFSTDSSSDYNDYYSYNGNNITFQSGYAISGGDFTPTTPSNTTEEFIRNTGQVLGAAGGDSVSIDYLGGTANDAAGLVLSTSATSDQNSLSALIFDGYTNNSSPYALFSYEVNGGSSSIPLSGQSNDPWTLTLTRETGADSGTVAYSLIDPAGNNFATPITGTLALPDPTSAYYFGISTFGGDNSGSGVTLDNLAFTPASAPEPSSYALMILGGGALAVFLRFKRLSV